MNDAIETVIEILDAFAADHAAGRVGGRGDYAAVADRIAAVHACSSDPALLALREARGLLNSFVEYEAADALSTREERSSDASNHHGVCRHSGGARSPR